MAFDWLCAERSSVERQPDALGCQRASGLQLAADETQNGSHLFCAFVAALSLMGILAP